MPAASVSIRGNEKGPCINNFSPATSGQRQVLARWLLSNIPEEDLILSMFAAFTSWLSFTALTISWEVDSGLFA